MSADHPAFVRDFDPIPEAQALSGSPRMGHTSDLSSLFSDDSSDYVMGLASSAIVLAVNFMIVLLLILLFMCCGRRRVGYLSGRPFQRPYNEVQQFDDEDSEDLAAKEVSEQKKEEKKCCWGLNTTVWVRSIFTVSGIIFITFAILLVTHGVTNMQETVNSVHRSSNDVSAIADEAYSIINTGLQDIKGIATTVREALREEVNSEDFCPADPDLEGQEGLSEIKDKADEAVEMLDEMDTFVGDDIDDVSEALREAGDGARSLAEETGDFDLTEMQALLVLIPMTLVPCLLVAAAIMAHYGVQVRHFTRAINWFLLPVFIFMVILCIVFATVSFVTASANADFCLPDAHSKDTYKPGSPDTSVFRILDANGFQGEDDFMRQVANYYVNQCIGVESPYSFLTDIIPDLEESRTQLNDLITEMDAEGTILELSLYCDKEFDTLDALLAEMKTILDVLLEALDRTMDSVSCERIVPIYHEIVYDGVCGYTITAMYWNFISFLIMSIMGVIMILLRSACKPNAYSDEAEQAEQQDKPASGDDGEFVNQKNKESEGNEGDKDSGYESKDEEEGEGEGRVGRRARRKKNRAETKLELEQEDHSDIPVEELDEAEEPEPETEKKRSRRRPLRRLMSKDDGWVSKRGTNAMEL